MADKTITKSVAKSLQKINNTRKQLGVIRTLAKEISNSLTKSRTKLTSFSADMKIVLDDPTMWPAAYP